MKKIIPLAICLATSYGMAGAQENISVYGLVDMSIARSDRIITGGRVTGNSATRVDSGGFNGSRWGVRGNEDLGGGYQAFFTLESGVQADTGVMGQGGRLFGRQAFLGLGGSFGRLSFGRQYTPWFNSLSQSDPFGNNLLGNSGQVEHANSRVDNSILYTSPDLSGFSIQALYALGENAGSVSTGSQADISVYYTRGPFWATFAHMEQKNAVGTAPAPVTSTLTGKADLVGASYDFGPVKIFGNYSRLRNIDAGVTPASSVRPGHRSKAWLVGFTAPVGSRGKFIASYISLNETAPTDRDARFWGAGYTYSLSKTTTLYTSFGRISNENGSVLTVGSPSYPGIGERQVHIGMLKRF